MQSTAKRKEKRFESERLKAEEQERMRIHEENQAEAEQTAREKEEQKALMSRLPKGIWTLGELGIGHQVLMELVTGIHSLERTPESIQQCNDTVRKTVPQKVARHHLSPFIIQKTAQGSVLVPTRKK